jgi:hypothetical protein
VVLADAYRHLLITGEMKRRFGPTLAAHFADGHEFVNNLTGSQTERDNEMDNLNNSVAANGPEFQTWEDVVGWARRKIIEAAPLDGDGENGRAFWHKKQPPAWRPDFTDIPIAPIEKGGPEHRYAPNDLMTAPMGMADASEPATAPLDRPVASWTEADVRTVLNSPAYLRPQHPKHIEAQALVRAWFERRFPGPVQVDATGRRKPDRDAASPSAQCNVPVRAHARNAGKVHVVAHCRARPAA